MSLTRRLLLGSTAALAPGAVIPAAHSTPTAPPHPDAELLALCREFHRLDHEANILPDEGEGPRSYADALDERWDVSDRLEGMHPATLDGRQAKAGVALALMEEHTNHGAATDGSAEDFVLAALRDVTGRAPVHAVGGPEPIPRGLDGHPSQLHAFLAIKGGMPDEVFRWWMEGGLRVAARYRGGAA